MRTVVQTVSTVVVSRQAAGAGNRSLLRRRNRYDVVAFGKTIEEVRTRSVRHRRRDNFRRCNRSVAVKVRQEFYRSAFDAVFGNVVHTVHISVVVHRTTNAHVWYKTEVDRHVAIGFIVVVLRATLACFRVWLFAGGKVNQCRQGFVTVCGLDTVVIAVRLVIATSSGR